MDVYAANDSKTMVIEVEMGEVDLETKLTALNEVDEILIVTESPTNNIEQSERVKACRITDYLTRLRSNNSINISGNSSINPEDLVSGTVPENEPGIKTGDNND